MIHGMGPDWVETRGSSFLRRVALEGRRAPFLLRLHLRRGGYLAYRVPAGAFERLLAAPSKGAFFNSSIKGIYPKVGG